MDNRLEDALSFRPDKTWILKESGLPYLELDIQVPAHDIMQEFRKVRHIAQYYKPDRFSGWKTLTIFGHGTDNHNTIDEPREFNPDIINDIPVTAAFLKKYWGCTDNNTRRISFMILDPWAYVPPHTDTKVANVQSSVNIAIYHPKGAGWRFTNYGDMPIADGKAFAIDSSKEHFVWNESNEERVHIVAFGPLKGTVIEDSYNLKYTDYV